MPVAETMIKANISLSQDRQSILYKLLKLGLEPYGTESPLKIILSRSLDLICSIPWIKSQQRGEIFIRDEKSGLLVMVVKKGEMTNQENSIDNLCACGQAYEEYSINFSKQADENHKVCFECVASNYHVCIPLSLGKKLIGMLKFYVNSEFSRNKDDEVFFSSIGHILATIIERKRAEAYNNRLLKEQIIIHSLLVLATKPEPLDQQLESALQIILSIPWIAVLSKGSIFLANEKKSSLRMVAHVGLSEELLAKCATIPYGQCLCGRAAATKDVIFKNSVDEEHDFRFEKMQPHGHYCIPMKLEHRLLGVINLYVPAGHDWNEREEQFLLAMTDVLVGMISRDRANKSLEMKNAQLVHGGRLTALGEMATGIAHEINQPLTYISGFIQSLMQDIDQSPKNKPKYQSRLEKAYGCVDRINQIIYHIRTFGRKDEALPGSGQEVNFCSVEKTVNNTLLLFGKKLEYSNIILNMDIAKNLPPASISSNQLEQVFINLFQNAVFALRENKDESRISITASLFKEGYIQILLSDNGFGMDASVQERVFEPFYTTKKIGEGTGLGLSIIHGIIQDRKGDIVCESKPGEGTTFKIVLPTFQNR